MTRPKKDLLRSPVGRTLVELALPMTVGLTAVILFNVVDTFWVGRLGAHELAAMSFTFPVVYFVMSLTLGMGVGVTASISRAIGLGDRTRVRRLTTDGLVLANSIVVVLAVGGLFTIDPLFKALGATPDLLPLVRRYMVPWYLAIGFLVIPMVGNSAIRATGDTKTPSLIMVIAGVVNAALDPFLIFGIGPFPRLDLQGAAIASAISWTTTFGAAFWILARREHMLDLSRPRFADVWHSWKTILYVSVPAAATNVMVPLAAGILTRMASAFGPKIVAAYGVGTRIEALSMIGAASLAAAVAPFAGQNFGAGNVERLHAAFRFVTRVCLGYGVFIAAVLALAARPLARVFNDDPEVIANITHYVTIIPISYGFFGTMLVINSMFNGLNRPLKAAVIIILRLFVLAVPLAWLGARFAGVTGLFIGIAAANGLVGIAAVLILRNHLASVDRDPLLGPRAAVPEGVNEPATRP